MSQNLRDILNLFFQGFNLLVWVILRLNADADHFNDFGEKVVVVVSRSWQLQIIEYLCEAGSSRHQLLTIDIKLL